MKKYILGAILGVTLISIPSHAKTYQIGATQIVEHSVLDSVRVGFEKGLKDSGIEYKIDYENAQGDMLTQQLIGKGFASKKKDLILAISTPSVQAVANSTENIPVLFGAVSDPSATGISDRKNVTGVADAIPTGKLVEETLKLFPNTKKVGIIYNTSEKNSESNIARIQENLKGTGVEIVTSGVTALNDIPASLEVLLKKVDVLYMLPDNMVVSASTLIFKRAKDTKKPVLALGYNQEQISTGALLSVSVDYEKLGYRLGEMASDILTGKKEIKDLPYEVSNSYPVLVNKDMEKFYNINIDTK
ncbi:MAG: ABC transporter substrate-binding protein [Fusobacteriaceae bacterium]